MTSGPLPLTVAAAGIGLAVEAIAGIAHGASLIAVARVAEETQGLAALPPLGGEVTSATLLFLMSAGLLAAAPLLVRHSRTARRYALGVQGMVLVVLVWQTARGLPSGAMLAWAAAAVVVGALLLTASAHRWASVGPPQPARQG